MPGPELTDDELIHAMFSRDDWIATKAREIYAARHPGETTPGSKEERDAGVIRDPYNGWALRND